LHRCAKRTLPKSQQWLKQFTLIDYSFFQIQFATTVPNKLPHRKPTNDSRKSHSMMAA
jgi:hypothetical protein